MHQDHHTSNTSFNTDSKTYQMFYTDLDLWTLTVDQLKQHMKDLGIYHGCSKLRKEELIERIKEFNHPHEHDHHGEKRKHDEHYLKKEELSPKKEKVDDSVFEEDLLHPHSFDDLSLTMKGEQSMTNNNINTTPHPHKSNEHRKRRFVSSCPIKTKERIERALTQKLFLIERKEKSAHEQSFVVLGTTGNVYDVVINEEPSCKCPDGEKGNLCKHIVLRIGETSPLIYQHALLPSELEEIFSKAPPINNNNNNQSTIANSEAIITYKHMKGEGERSSITSSTHCPICCDGFPTREEKAEAKYCHCCGVNIHLECVKAWKGFNKEYPCPLCKANKLGEHLDGSHKAKMNEGYLNLSEFQPEITTTEREYVHSNKWNQRYGYGYGSDDGSTSEDED